MTCDKIKASADLTLLKETTDSETGLPPPQKKNVQRPDSEYQQCYLAHIMSLVKQQFVLTHTVRQIEIPALPYSWVTKTHCVRIVVSTTKLLVLVLSLRRWSI
jgi:hypothetical protein